MEPQTNSRESGRRNAGTRGQPAEALVESTWLKDPTFLRTSDWPFQPSDKTMRSKLKTLDPNKIPTEPKYQETTAITAKLVSYALTLEWQKYSSYENFLRLLAYILRLLPKFSGNRTKTGSITDPAEFEVAVQKPIYLVQSE